MNIQKTSKKVSGREVLGTEWGGGETRLTSTTFTVSFIVFVVIIFLIWIMKQLNGDLGAIN